MRRPAWLIAGALWACTAPDDPSRPPKPGHSEEWGDSADSADSADTQDTAPPAPPRSVLFVLMDDLWVDGAAVMPSVQARVPNALVFERAYVDTPLCCPTRASLLAGGFLAQQTGVLENSSPNGGASAFVDVGSMPARLQGAGYRTALIGKYLNEFTDLGAYVPPGWDAYRAVEVGDDFRDYTVVSGSSTPTEAGVATVAVVPEYVTDFQTTEALTFLDEVGADPFFLYLTFNAPHFPSIPADQDVGTFAGAVRHRAAYDEEDVSDKPAHVQEMARIDAATAAEYDAAYAQALDSLLAADRAIEAVLAALEASGRGEDTVVVFASDNGFLWGEHRLFHKGYPYEEAARVPLYVWGPGVSAGVSDELVSVSLDVPATIWAATQVDGPTAGVDLLDPAAVRPGHLLLEASGLVGAPAYTGVVTREWKYVEYASGDVELYDLVSDPFELASLAADPAQADTLAALGGIVAERRALTMSSQSFPLVVGEAFSRPLATRGGVAPLSFSITHGVLPAGVTLSSDGVFSGTPEAAGDHLLAVRVTDSSVSPYHGGPQDYERDVLLTVTAPSARRAARRPAPQVQVGARSATVRLPVPQGARPVLRCGLDADLDMDPHRVAAAPGPVAVMALDGLRPDTRYDCRVDGVGEDVRFRMRTKP